MVELSLNKALNSTERNPGQRRRICAVIVTFHPEPSLVENVELLRTQVSEVFIVDNGSDANSRVLLEQIEGKPGVHTLRNERNLGIAAALNIGVRHAMAGG